MNLKDIQNLIKFVAKSGASEVKLEMEDIKITIKTGSDDKGGTAYVQQIPAMPQQMQMQMPPQPQVATPAQTQVQTVEAGVEEDSKYVTIKSPIIGTFYRKPAPDKAPFVEVG